MSKKLYVVGIGPGGADHLTPAALHAIAAATSVVGYKTYLDLIPTLLVEKHILSSGMLKEVDRCSEALALAAAGEVVALVSSGDSGIYGMAGLVLELARGGEFQEVEIEIVPGVSAVQAAASRLGAPLMHDFAVISLSDLLTPWPLIRRRLEAAGSADFVVALYNPKSKGRVTQLAEAAAILRRHRPAATPVGIVRNACRPGETVVVTDLAGLPQQEVDMLSVVVIGNASTIIDGAGRMVTPRGYAGKYGLGAGVPGPAPPGERAAALFVGGTGSDVGKSVITAGLCRLLLRRGYRVAPFKAQNMALNSAVTPQGGEIGRAQALQAAACGLAPHTDMNPVLLKPNSAAGSQVVVHGRPVGNMSVQEYHAYKPTVFAEVAAAYGRLAAAHQVVVLEGAGSIAEINLMAHDITNLRAAALAGAPVLLVADIDRGGVFAAIVGTLELLAPQERAMVAGVIINKFRGDATLLQPGIEAVQDRTGVPVIGVVPWLDLQLPEEDSVALGRKPAVTGGGERLRIGVIRLPHLSNYTDFDPLEREPQVDLVYLTDPGQVAVCDLLIVPGTKNTLADLADLRARGFARAIHEFHQAGGSVVGICGGLQMLGRTLADPHGVESGLGEAEGLGLLDLETVLTPFKQTHQVAGVPLPAAAAAGLGSVAAVSGYEIHMGESTCGPLARPLWRLTSRSGRTVSVEDGAVSADGRVWGTYLHGLFEGAQLRQGLLDKLRAKRGLAAVVATPLTSLEAELDRLALHLEAHLDLEGIFALLPAPGGTL